MRRPGDWSLTQPGPGAGRLVLRVSQRLLSRHRRHGDGADGAGPTDAAQAERRRTAPARPVERGLRWLLAHAEPRRRLGGVRPRHQPRGADQGSVRRSQRHARSELSRTSPPACWRRSASTAIGVGHPQVDRGLAFLRRDAGTSAAAGSAAGASTTSTAPGRCWPGWQAIGFDMSDPMVRRAVAWLKQVQQPGGGWGETLPQLRRSVAWPARARRPPRRPPGPCSACSPPARPTATRSAPASTICSRTQRADGNWHEEPVHRHRLPEGVLSEVSLVSPLLPADGAGALPSGADGRVSGDQRRRQPSRESTLVRRLSPRGADVTAEGASHAFSPQPDDRRWPATWPARSSPARSASRWC